MSSIDEEDMGPPPSTNATPKVDGRIAQWKALLQPLHPDTFKVKPPPRKWLLDKVLPLGKVGILAAEGGAGKTISLCQLALAVTTGMPWLGTFNVAQEHIGRVLLVLGEEEAEEVRRRMWNASRAMGIGPDMCERALQRITTLPLAGVPCSFLEHDGLELKDSAFVVWLRGEIGKPTDVDPLRLIVLDPLSRFGGADAETDNAAATRFIQSVEALSTMTGATTVVAHHTNKIARGSDATTSTGAARGSSALTDGARWVATMKAEDLVHEDDAINERLDCVITLTIPKSNYAKRPAPSTLRHDNDHGGALVICDEMDRNYIEEARGKRKGAAANKRADAAVKTADTKARKADFDIAMKMATAARADVAKLEKDLSKEKDEAKRVALENDLAEKRRVWSDREARLAALSTLNKKGDDTRGDKDGERFPDA